MRKIIGLAFISILLNACSQSKDLQPTVLKAIQNPRAIQTPSFTKAIDWTKIDKADKNATINNRPSINQTRFDDVILKSVMSNNVSKSQAIRILDIQNAIHDEGVLEELQKQLGKDLAFSSWGFGTPDGNAVTSASLSSNDDDIIRNYRFLVMTKPNIKAEMHQYIFTTGSAKGMTLPIQILPIAKRTNEEISAIYSDEQISQKIMNIVKNYGGELQGIGVGLMQVVHLDVYFPKGVPSETDFLKLEAELEQLTDLDINVARSSVHISPM